MAVVRNITEDARSLFRADSPPADAGDEVTIPDETFADRAWPKSTWELVQKPGDGYVDASIDDAYLFVADEPGKTIAELKQEAADMGVDLTGLTKKADIIAAIAAGPTTEESV